MRNRYLCPLLVTPLTLVVATSLSAGWRPPTQEEKDFRRTVLETIARAMPPGPEGWQLISQTEIRELERVYAGSEREPFKLEYSVEWTDVAKKQEADSKVAQAWLEYERAHADDPQGAAIRQENAKLAEAVGQAAGRGDRAAVERLMKQSDALAAKDREFQQKAAKERDALRASNEAHDFRVQITVWVNQYMALDQMAQAPPVAGLPVYRMPGSHAVENGWNEEINEVVFGKNLRMVTSNGLIELRSPPFSKMSYPAVHLIRVRVEADPPRARQALDSIRWDLLKSLVH